jgi:DNA-directed RNA polymerase
VQIRESLTDVFTRAIGIQDWFNRCVRLIIRSSPPDHCSVGEIPTPMTPIVWTTPLGLPVVQQYRKGLEIRSLGHAIESFLPDIKDPSAPPREIDAAAQLRAFPPNYVHSLDATHMMRTALAMKVRARGLSSRRLC